MATKSTNPTTRETSATTFDRGERNLIVTIHHGVIKIRLTQACAKISNAKISIGI